MAADLITIGKIIFYTSIFLSFIGLVLSIVCLLKQGKENDDSGIIRYENVIYLVSGFLFLLSSVGYYIANDRFLVNLTQITWILPLVCAVVFIIVGIIMTMKKKRRRKSKRQ